MNYNKSLSPKLSIPIIIFILSYHSCTHDPTFMDDPPIDQVDSTGNSIDTMVIENPCINETVYFEKQILPILRSNCALSDCHNAASAKDGVILESYQSVISTADVEPFNLDDSELYEVLIEDNPEKMMPPSPRNQLSQDQVNLISQWILQGAKDLTCEEKECNLDGVTYTMDIAPIIVTHCKGCHSNPNPSDGIQLDSYNAIRDQVDNRKLIGAITWASGYKKMPQGQAMLNNCSIDKIKFWIEDGAKKN